MAEADPIAEARALLFQFTRSSLKACHIAAGDVELACSRDPAIRIADLLRDAPPAASEAEACAPPSAQTLLRAPHVATLVSLVAEGSNLAAGDSFARITLLDETIDLPASSGGVVRTHLGALGDLIEFDQPLLALAS